MLLLRDLLWMRLLWLTLLERHVWDACRVRPTLHLDSRLVVLPPYVRRPNQRRALSCRVNLHKARWKHLKDLNLMLLLLLLLSLMEVLPMEANRRQHHVGRAEEHECWLRSDLKVPVVGVLAWVLMSLKAQKGMPANHWKFRENCDCDRSSSRQGPKRLELHWAVMHLAFLESCGCGLIRRLHA